MSSKKFSINAIAASLLSKDLRHKVIEGKLEDLNAEQTEELSKGKAFFGLEDLNTQVEFSVSLESFLWNLFEQLKAPESPLRMKAHERFLQEVATELDKTIETEELPSLKPEALQKVVQFVEDPDLFTSLNVTFEFSAGDKKRGIPLPAANVLQSESFVSLLDNVFKEVTSLER